MKLLIIFIYLISINFSYAIEKPNIKNLVLTKNEKTYERVIFKDKNQKNVDLADYKGKLLVLNFWATWCAPCREEMPSLDSLQSDHRLNNLKVFPNKYWTRKPIKVKNIFRGIEYSKFRYLF